MANTVQRSVFLKDPETGEERWLHKGDEVPDWGVPLLEGNSLVFEDDQPEHRALEEDVAQGDGGPVEGYDPYKGQQQKTGLTSDELEGLGHKDLDPLLEERGLSKSGTIAEKVARLEEFDASQS